MYLCTYACYKYFWHPNNTCNTLSVSSVSLDNEPFQPVSMFIYMYAVCVRAAQNHHNIVDFLFAKNETRKQLINN